VSESVPTTIIQEIRYPPIINSGVQLFVLRDDLIHPFLNGNKWRKLKYNIPLIKENHSTLVITFGGAWSNHLVATAAAGKMYGFPSIGIVRGDEAVSNDALQFAQECGMTLHFISREKYRERNIPEFQWQLEKELRQIHPELLEEKFVYWLPEGGANQAALKGCEEIPLAISIDSNFICCACGTGSTLAGIARGMKKHQVAIGIPVLNAETYFNESLIHWEAPLSQIELHHQFTFGGYAKKNKLLTDFCEHFSKHTTIPVEPVYTGKMFYGLTQLIQGGHFPHGSVITAVHTGGIFDFNQEFSRRLPSG